MKSRITKSWLKLLPSLELTVNPSKSALYGRLLIIIYALTTAFIFHSSIYLMIKIVLLVFIGWQFKNYFHSKKPHPELYEIKYKQLHWVITTQDGHHDIYVEATILIHNMLFQMIKLSSPQKNKIIILFNDQLSKHQLRLLHLKAANIGI